MTGRTFTQAMTSLYGYEWEDDASDGSSGVFDAVGNITISVSAPLDGPAAVSVYLVAGSVAHSRDIERSVAVLAPAATAWMADRLARTRSEAPRDLVFDETNVPGGTVFYMGKVADGLASHTVTISVEEAESPTLAAAGPWMTGQQLMDALTAAYDYEWTPADDGALGVEDRYGIHVILVEPPFDRPATGVAFAFIYGDGDTDALTRTLDLLHPSANGLVADMVERGEAAPEGEWVTEYRSLPGGTLIYGASTSDGHVSLFVAFNPDAPGSPSGPFPTLPAVSRQGWFTPDQRGVATTAGMPSS